MPLKVAVIGADALPLVGPPPSLMTVTWYWSPPSPWVKEPSVASSAVRSGNPTIGVAAEAVADGLAEPPPVTVTVLVTCSPSVDSCDPNPACRGMSTVSVIGGYD